jgi:hypothetical protein
MERHGKNDGARKSQLLQDLRDCVTSSRTLAAHLSSDPFVGREARSLLGRLETIRGELDAIEAVSALARRDTLNSNRSEFRSMFN